VHVKLLEDVSKQTFANHLFDTGNGKIRVIPETGGIVPTELL